MSERDFDVIVIGGGGAGLAAANLAADNGASVLLVEAAPKMGGSTALSTGVFWASNTSVQRSLGIVDNADDQFLYYMNVNQHKLEPSVVHRLCHESGPALEWLLSHGVTFPASGLYVSGVDGIPRGHRCGGLGQEIADCLEGALTGKPVEKAVATRVRKLVSGPGGIEGIEVDGAIVRAGAVVIASGGFGNNTRLLADYYPDAVKEGELNWYIGAKTNVGDGLEMALDVGADISPVNRGLILLTPGFAKEVEAHLPGWVVHVNRQGRRFVKESTEYSVLAEVLKEQTAGECFGIFDEATRAKAKAVPAPNWSADRLAQLTQQGYIRKADTLEQLADMCGIRPATLQTTVENYNRDCEAGADSTFFKEPHYLQPIATPPFYATRIRPAIVCWTGTGLRIDREARILNKADRWIPNLFGAGEATGGMFGECYAGGGASVGNAVIYGRISGENAARHALRNR